MRSQKLQGLTEVVLGCVLVSILRRLVAVAHHVNEVHAIVHDERICACSTVKIFPYWTSRAQACIQGLHTAMGGHKLAQHARL